MAIKFFDHLIDACTDNVIASMAISEPRRIGTPVDLDFSFIISYNPTRLDELCETFVDLIKSNPSLSAAIDKHVALGYEQRDSVIGNTFKYSAFKVLFQIKDLVDNGFNYYGAVPSNSFVFYGHKLLYYVFMDHNSFSPALNLSSNVYLNRVINIDLNIFDIIQKDPVYIDSINDKFPGGIFNKTYERVLSAFNEVEGIEVSKLSHREDIPDDSMYNPLGSLAYTNKVARPLALAPMEDAIATVSTPRSLTDSRSKFWNTACFISIEDIPDYFMDPSRGTPYIYVRTSSRSSFTLFAEVEAITGLSQEGLYTTYGFNPPKPSGSGPFNPAPINPDYIPSGSPNGENGPKPAFGLGSNNPPPNKGGNGRQNNSKENKKIRQFVQNSAKRFGRALTSDETRGLIRDASLSFLGHSLTARRQQALINSLKDINVVSDDQSVRTNFGIVGSDSKRRRIEFKGDDEGS
jgi:hypothetical protein